jgi:hypothetical protein
VSLSAHLYFIVYLHFEFSDEPNRGFLAYFNWNTDSETQSSQYSTEHEWEYALELADVNTSIVEHENATAPHIQNTECILSMPKSRDDNNGKLRMGLCDSDEAWSWSIDEGGVLTWERNLASIRQEKRSEFGVEQVMGGALSRFLDVTSNLSGSSAVSVGEENQSRCLRKAEGATAVTASCDPSDQDSNGSSLVSFSVIQYQNSAAVSPKLPRFPRPEVLAEQQDNEQSESKEESTPSSPAHAKNIETVSATVPAVTPHNLPTMKRSSQSHAAIHEAPKTMKSKGPNLQSGRQSSTATAAKKGNSPFHTELSKEILSPLSFGGYFERKVLENKGQPGVGSGKLLHHPPSPVASPMPDDFPHRPRKIPVHPYIAASKNGYYKDELTGLSYPTDISEYLGHERKESGRHTLAGVGLYTRTMLKIKVCITSTRLDRVIFLHLTMFFSSCTQVYGVAFYVAKRDVLADPVFEQFADKSVEELRQSSDFYNHLMTMRSNSHGGGHFDRTLFIQLNMQLATETVRQSLTGDWQLLTDEHKAMLSDTSAMERQADERMLSIIEGEENTSNCACGQLAPPEYEADASCCARGTEMVFTWRKNGDFEVSIFTCIGYYAVMFP